MQEAFRENGVEFAHKNVTVYLPPKESEPGDDESQCKETDQPPSSDPKFLEAAAAAAALAAAQEEEDKNKPDK
jgi:hypothetical protein